MSYAEDIARWRVQRAQQQIANRCEQIESEYREVQRERDQAIAENDLDTAELRDMDCQQLEQEYAQYRPPQQQVPQAWANWVKQNQHNLAERFPGQAPAAVEGAISYMMRPRRRDTTDPRYTGMGMTAQQVMSPQGLD